MKRLVLVIPFLLFTPFFVSNCNAKEILAVAKVIYQPYEKALDSFSQTTEHHITVLNIQGMREREVLRTIYQENPDLVLAIGGEVLEYLDQLERIPIFSIMAPVPMQGREEVFGISMEIPARLQLHAIKKAFPDLSRLGILFSNKHSSSFIKEAQDTANSMNVNLVTHKVERIEQIPGALTEIRKDIEMLWVFQDPSIVTTDTLEDFFLIPMGKGIPVLSFSESHNEYGSLGTVSTDPDDLGKQASELVNRLLRGEKGSYSGVAPRKAKIIFNIQAVRKFGLTVTVESPH